MSLQHERRELGVEVDAGEDPRAHVEVVAERGDHLQAA
jgi:hypothetical protein